MSRSNCLIPTLYDHEAARFWLHGHFAWAGFNGPDFHDASPAGRGALVDWLRRRCASVRAAGIAGSWHYDLPLHTELCRILKAEQAEIAAMESLPAFPDRQRLRAA